jgi:hypothetical protein
MTDLVSRRQMLFLALFAGGALADTPPPAAPKVNEKDSMAVALGYVSDATRVDKKAYPMYQPGSTCSNCSWYHGDSCSFFPSKSVEPTAWCRMWHVKP